MSKYRVRLEFIEAVLGTVALDPEAYTEFAGGANAPDPATVAEELEGLPGVQKGLTGFFRLPDGTPYMLNYVLKGFCKEACSIMRRVSGSKSSKITAFKKVIDGLVFVEPRQIVLHLPTDATLEVLSRPLRAETALGARVAIARSEMCPPGTWMEFEIEAVGGVVDEATLQEWLDYGRRKGLGAWRNAGYGAFKFTMQGQC